MDKKITLRHLEAFRAMMVRRSVTGAAEMLQVTQPVVTRLLMDLEERIAIPLFKRVKGRLLPTPEAMLLSKDVHESLLGVERIANAAENIRALKLARLEIAAAPAMALSFLPRAIASFSIEYPETLISLHTHSTSRVFDMVQSGKCDLGFAMMPSRRTAVLNCDELLRARMVAVVPANHRLAGQKVLRPEHFEGERFISLSPLQDERTKIDALMIARGINRRINVETQLSSTVIKLVEAGAGLALVEPLTASAFTGDTVKFIPFEPEIQTAYCTVFSERMSSTIILKPFIDHAKREIRKMVPSRLLVRS